MWNPIPIVAVSFAFVSVACGSSSSTANPAPVPQDDAGVTDAADAESPDQASDAVPEATPEAATAILTFTQAIDGAMLVNPSVYAGVPVRLTTSAPVDAVVVTLDGVIVSAVGDANGLDWVATVATDSLVEGTIAITARATSAGAEVADAIADLVVSTTGVQLSQFAIDGPALCPRVHRSGDGLVMTWSDRSDADQNSEAWLRRIDGGGRWIGDKVHLVDESDDTLYARTAIGNEGIGVLYQKHGGPYHNKFLIAALDGTPIRAPIDLDEPGEFGSTGGDILFDGTAYVIVWRVNDGAAGGKVKWARIPEDGTPMTGPVVVAAYAPLDAANQPADGDVGGMDPFTPIGVGLVGQQTIATFTRGRWLALLDQELPKTQYRTVGLDGTTGAEGFAGQPSLFWWDWSTRVFALHGGLEIVRMTSDLNDTNPNHHLYYATHVDASGDVPAQGLGSLMLNPPGQLDDVFLIEHPDQGALLAWLDLRSYEIDITTGAIQLFVAPVGDDMAAGTPTVFEHARFIASTSELNGVVADTNLFMTWLDERHGGGVLDPRPELWIDTAWY